MFWNCSLPFHATRFAIPVPVWFNCTPQAVLLRFNSMPRDGPARYPWRSVYPEMRLDSCDQERATCLQYEVKRLRALVGEKDQQAKELAHTMTSAASKIQCKWRQVLTHQRFQQKALGVESAGSTMECGSKNSSSTIPMVALSCARMRGILRMASSPLCSSDPSAVICYLVSSASQMVCWRPLSPNLPLLKQMDFHVEKFIRAAALVWVP